ncbi:preprotein translocase subunit YajC [Treponema sp.]|uniref:preprotein translocase subunit YajC n=1 Tax=Treponema sp. TaxID=166 RepID=UPI003EFC6E7B
MLSNSLLLQSADAMGGGFGMFLPLILIMGIMYFFMIRPQNKKQKELQKMLDALQKGDKVVTIGGIHGTVSSVKKDSDIIVVKVDENTKIEFSRSAISSVVSDKPAQKSEEKKSAKKQKEENKSGSDKKSSEDSEEKKDE